MRNNWKKTQKPTAHKTLPFDDTKGASQQRHLFDTIAEGGRNFIRQIITFSRKAGKALLRFFAQENIKKISNKITGGLTLFGSETLTESDSITEPVRNFDEVKATHFEDTELPFTEKERLKEEIEKCKRTKQIEEAPIETTDRTEGQEKTNSSKNN